MKQGFYSILSYQYSYHFLSVRFILHNVADWAAAKTPVVTAALSDINYSSNNDPILMEVKNSV